MIKRIKKGCRLSISRECITFCQFCQTCELEEHDVHDMIDQGLLDPKGKSLKNWRFTTEDIIRAKRVKRLQKDLEINLPGAVLVLELVDEIEHLRGKLLQWESRY